MNTYKCFSCGDNDATNDDSMRVYYGPYGTRRLHFRCIVDQAMSGVFSKRTMRRIVKKMHECLADATYEFNQRPSYHAGTDFKHPLTGEVLNVFRPYRERGTKKKYAVCSNGESEMVLVEL